MSLFDWKAEYSVGSPEIDLQHRQLFRMAAELHGAMVNGRGTENVESLLERLVSYTRHHFSCEERLMRDSGYPGFKEHHEAHEKLAQQVGEFQGRVKGRKVAVTTEMMRFLRDWLGHHILGADKKVGAHLQARQKSMTALR